MTPPRSVTVIGAGLAGLRTIERLRERGYQGGLALIGAEPHLPYDRPPLSKQVLRDEGTQPWLRPVSEYAGLAVDVEIGHRVGALDTHRQVIESDGRETAYDVLVIATGATPRRLPGVNGRVLRTWDDAVDLRSELRLGARLAIIGAGLIGCEVAATSRSLGVRVDLIDLLPGPLIRVLGDTVCNLVANLHREHGVNLHMGVSVERTETNHLSLADGTVLDPDVVLEAIGATPETDWLENSEVCVDDGVVCDAAGRAADNVFAVGDVARWNGHRNEHWTSAGEQADRVAATILGQEPPPADVGYWWSDQYDIKLQGVGTPLPDDDVQLVTWGPKARDLALYSRSGRLSGVVGFSAAAAVMKLRPNVAAGTEVDAVLHGLGA